jgi:hypothetical protein
MFKRLFDTRSSIASITAQEAWERVTAPKTTAMIIDVRETWEFQQGHAPGARNIPLSQLGKRFNEIPADRDILLICRSAQPRYLQAPGSKPLPPGMRSIWPRDAYPPRRNSMRRRETIPCWSGVVDTWWSPTQRHSHSGASPVTLPTLREALSCASPMAPRPASSSRPRVRTRHRAGAAEDARTAGRGVETRVPCVQHLRHRNRP